MYVISVIRELSILKVVIKKLKPFLRLMYGVFHELHRALLESVYFESSKEIFLWVIAVLAAAIFVYFFPIATSSSGSTNLYRLLEVVAVSGILSLIGVKLSFRLHYERINRFINNMASREENDYEKNLKTPYLAMAYLFTGLIIGFVSVAVHYIHIIIIIVNNPDAYEILAYSGNNAVLYHLLIYYCALFFLTFVFRGVSFSNENIMYPFLDVVIVVSIILSLSISLGTLFYSGMIFGVFSAFIFSIVLADIPTEIQQKNVNSGNDFKNMFKTEAIIIFLFLCFFGFLMFLGIPNDFASRIYTLGFLFGLGLWLTILVTPRHPIAPGYILGIAYALLIDANFLFLASLEFESFASLWPVLAYLSVFGILLGWMFNTVYDKRGLSIRKIFTKAMLYSMKANNKGKKNVFTFNFTREIFNFETYKLRTNDFRYREIEKYILNPLSNSNFVVIPHLEEPVPANNASSLLNSITIEVPMQHLRKWERRLIDTLDRIPDDNAQATIIKTLAQNSGLTEEQVMAVLILPKSHGLKLTRKDIFNIVRKAPVNLMFKYFDSIPVDYSVECYEKIKKSTEEKWLHMLVNEVNSQNPDLTFLVGLFAILDYSVYSTKDVKNILARYYDKLQDRDVRVIKDFLLGVQELSFAKLLGYTRRFPQLGLWVALEFPELIKDRLTEFLESLLNRKLIRHNVLDFLLSAGGFISLETLKYLELQLKENKIDLLTAVTLAGKTSRPYDYTLFEKIKSVNDFTRAVQSLKSHEMRVK